MVTYLVGMASSENYEEDSFNLRLVDAETPEDAIIKYRKNVYPQDPDFLDNLADKSINLSFSEQFWLSTPQENAIFMSSGTVISTEEDLANRIFKEFGDENRDIAREYIKYLLSDEEADVERLPKGFAEFVAGSRFGDSYCHLFAWPLHSIQKIG